MDLPMDALYAHPLALALGAASLLLLVLGRHVLKPILTPLVSLFRRDNRTYPPIAGTIFHQFLNLHRLQDFQTDLSRKYKTFRILTPFGNYIYTVDPANLEYFLKTNFANYGKGESFHDIMKDLLGDGIFAVDGDKWRQQRKIASYEFSTKVLRDYSSNVFKMNACKLAEIVSEAASSNLMIDVQDLLMKATLDSVFKISFGVELNTLTGSRTEGTEFGKAFDDASGMSLQRFFDVFWKFKRFFNIRGEAVMKRSIKHIDNFVYKVIESKIKEQEEQRDGMTTREDILSRFLMERKKDPTNMSYKYLRDIILSFVIAGRDTTAGTLSWFFYMLCKNPDVQVKIAKEVREATNIKGEIPVSEFCTSLTEDALSNMQYLHAALTETLRLYPAVPLDVKTCFSDDTLPDGFAIRKGDFLNYQPYAMGRMKFLWGEDAEDFCPSRWLNADGNFEAESPFKFAAFQAGPRICLGKDFAYRQMKIVAATLVFFFRFELWDDKPVNYRTMLTLQVDQGLRIRALHR